MDTNKNTSRKQTKQTEVIPQKSFHPDEKPKSYSTQRTVQREKTAITKKQKQKLRREMIADKKHKRNAFAKTRGSKDRVDSFAGKRLVPKAEGPGYVNNTLLPPLPWTSLFLDTTWTRCQTAIAFGYDGAYFHGLQYSTDTWAVENELVRAFFLAGCIHPSSFAEHSRLNLRRCARTDKGVHSIKTIVSIKLQFITDPRFIAPYCEMCRWYLDGYYATYDENRKDFLDSLIQIKRDLEDIPNPFQDRMIYHSGKPATDPVTQSELSPLDIPFSVSPQEWESSKTPRTVGIENLVYPKLPDDTINKQNFSDLSLFEKYAKQAMDRVNYFLPAGMHVYSISRVPKKFAPRFFASGRHYKYLLPAWILTAKYSGKSLPLDYVLPQELAYTPRHPDESTFDFWYRVVATTGDLPTSLKPPIYETSSQFAQSNLKDTRALEPNFKSSVSKILSNGKFSGPIFERFNKILSNYNGLHRFHSFTIKVSPIDTAAERRMFGVYADDTPVIVNGEPWITVNFLGQSFMYHQIRRMISLAVVAIRDLIPEKDLFPACFDYQGKYVINTGPSLGLMLDDIDFDHFNKSLEQIPKMLVPLDETTSNEVFHHMKHSKAKKISKKIDRTELHLGETPPELIQKVTPWIFRSIVSFDTQVQIFSDWVQRALPLTIATHGWKLEPVKGGLPEKFLILLAKRKRNKALRVQDGLKENLADLEAKMEQGIDNVTNDQIIAAKKAIDDSQVEVDKCTDELNFIRPPKTNSESTESEDEESES